jgi:hypothetical protein
MVFPVPEIVPALAFHVTLVLELPPTVATKVCEPPAEILVALGEMVTETTLAFWPDDVEFAAPPQEVSSATTNAAVEDSAQRTNPTLEYRMFAMSKQLNFKRKETGWKLTSGHVRIP